MKQRHGINVIIGYSFFILGGRKKILFIVNPFSGAKLGKEIADVLDKNLDKDKYDYDLEFTAYSGHAIELAKAAVASQYFAVIGAGGDGTINEVAHALQGTNTAMGIIPLGSGNGFAYHLKIDRDITKAIQIINKGHLEIIDIGSVNDRFFVNVAGIGLDAAVAFKTKKNKKRGFLPYFKQSLIEGLKFKKRRMHIVTSERSWSGDYTMVVIANGSVYGYDFSIAPQAILDDGLFDVLLIRHVSLWKYLLLLPRFFNKSIHKSHLVEYFKTREIAIQLDGDDFYHIDGEGFEAREKLNFKIIPQNLKIITQPENQ